MEESAVDSVGSGHSDNLYASLSKYQQSESQSAGADIQLLDSTERYGYTKLTS